MKKTSYIVQVALVLSSCWLMTSCNKDEGSGEPVINMVQTTVPDEEGVPLKAAGLGQTIDINGQYLGTTKAITANGYPVTVNPAFRTDTNVIIEIPDETPNLATADSVSNELVLTTDYGQITYPLIILPPPPVVQKVSNEFAKAGDKLTIMGKYFYFVDTVYFPGGVFATDVTSADNGSWLTVTVPDGITAAGTIKVATQSGTGTLDPAYRFNDPTGMICNFDDINPFGPWGPKPVLQGEGDSPAPLDGNYVHSYDAGPIIPGSWWNNDWLIPMSGINYPDISGKSSDYALKFEMNVPDVWNSGWYEVNFAWTYFYRFKPWEVNQKDPDHYWNVSGDRTNLKTNGWVTMEIPLNMFRLKPGGNPDGDPLATVDDILGNDLLFAFQNPGEPDGVKLNTLNVNIDNLRIVKIK